jgi:subtilisin family serine protease
MNRARKGAVAILATLCAFGGSAVAASATPGDVAAAGPATSAATPAPVADSRVLIGLEPGTTDAAARAIAAQAGAVDYERVADTLIVTPAAASAAGGELSAQSRALDADPHVRYVEPNYEITASAATPPPNPPTDPVYPQQWGLQGISTAGVRANSAWNTTIGSRDVVVGVLDSGADLSHPDLVDNLWSNGDALGGCGFGTHGFNAVEDNCFPQDDDGHGTHVSGIIGATGNNGIGVTGVAQQVSLMELRMLRHSNTGTATGSVADAVQAIDWALAAKAAGVNLRVLQASWGAHFVSFPQSLYDAVNRAYDAGVLFVAAAGNGTVNVDNNTEYPCAFGLGNILCIAAGQESGALASFSNYGVAAVDMSAPGVGIMSTVPPGLVSGCGSSAYCAYDGTSMAAPFVAGGAVALLSAQGSLTLAQLRAKLLDAARPIAALNGKVTTGGTFDLCRVMPACNGNPQVLPSAPENLTATVTGNQVKLDWTPPTSSGSAFVITGYRVRWNGNVVKIALPDGDWYPPSTYTITGLANDTNVTFEVDATNRLPLSTTPWGPSRSVTVRPHTGGAPSVVRSLASTVTNNNTTLTWQAPTSTGGGTITGYKVSWAGYTEYVGIPAGQSAPPTTLLVPGVPAAGFTVSATNMLPLDGPGTVWGPSASLAAAGEYTALSPARILDTRNGTGGKLGPLGPAGSYALQVSGAGGVPASGVAAVVMNVTVTGPTNPGFLTAWPTGAARPTISNLNFVPGQTVPNLVTVKLGAGGKVSLFNSQGNTQVIADVVGYYAAADGNTGSRFHEVTPFRYFDTRSGQGGVAKAPIGPASTLRFKVTGKGGVPASGVTGVVMNVTVTAPTSPGFLTVFPDDVARPNASSLNFAPGQTVPNLVAVRVPANGTVDFFNSAGSTQVIADVVGYYDGTKTTDAGRFVPVDPVRLLDTRSNGGALTAQGYRVLPVAGVGGVPSVGAAGAILNVTVTEPTSAGFVTVFPDDQCSTPTASNLNFVAGQTVPNLVATGLAKATACTNTVGAVDIYNSAGRTQVIADLFGFFTS